ncbi:lytic transglycosylase domain-containing protein [Aggregatibacter actinomycetemcomitans]|uniref:lytic transglycosylase domain-containing protein n=1 Tax=Aggregatibacter actinomycetemcomitans TaxID=714 RepID=UPI00197CA2EA|nr:lytic transglycosylase domain-containing protein [Aggregatibacter actinomycetemcomitans]MBN6059390.1 lytic transglycosylase domain-containing protein [Aggregatibacter actinomycetemcomitans]MBN6087891.1 lytic transglycosylase domain-containing protein [Aggregatibacter actinomycetemcomitans]
MSMTIFKLIATCAPLIHPDTALSVIKEESQLNQFAIGVVDGWIKQPTDLESALLAVQELEADGKNYSLGLMQVNKNNFDTYGVTAEQMFEPCHNLQVAQQILQDCYQRGESVNNALSCYYSGNFTRGYKKDFHGTSYVERVHAQLNEPTPEKTYVIPSLKNEPVATAPIPAVAIAKTTKRTSNKQEKNNRKRKIHKNLPPIEKNTSAEDKDLVSINL